MINTSSRPLSVGFDILPDRIVLFVIGSTAVAWKPLQRDGRFCRIGRHVVRGVWLCAFNHQMSGGYDGRHFVTGHAVVISEISFPKVFNGDVTAVNVMTAFGQRSSVSLKQS